MAFATSNLVLQRNGAAYALTGKWTGSIGDAAGTVTAPGMVVEELVFNCNKASGGPANDPAVSWTATNGVITVTVQNSVAVTNGNFKIVSR